MISYLKPRELIQMEANYSSNDESPDRIFDNGEFVKLVKNVDDQFEFDREYAASLFESPKVKGCPVAIVAALGCNIKGNHKLIAKMIQYLVKSNENVGNGDGRGKLLQEEDIVAQFKTAILESSADEMSIIIWSKPIFVSLAEGGQVAVFFLDILIGTMDESLIALSDDQMKKYFQLAGLCVHLASNIVYFNKDSLNNIDWDHLSKITGEGLRSSELKGHQKITFLIRDWVHPLSFSHGERGGAKALKQFINDNPTHHNISYLKNIYSELNCFLLPPFGDTHDERLRTNFDQQLIKFLETVLHRSYIDAKKISGSVIKGTEVVEMIQDYSDSLERNDPPINLQDLPSNNDTNFDRFNEVPSLEGILQNIKKEKQPNTTEPSSNDGEQLVCSQTFSTIPKVVLPLPIQTIPQEWHSTHFQNESKISSTKKMSLAEFLTNYTTKPSISVIPKEQSDQLEERKTWQSFQSKTAKDILNMNRPEPIENHFKSTDNSTQLLQRSNIPFDTAHTCSSVAVDLQPSSFNYEPKLPDNEVFTNNSHFDHNQGQIEVDAIALADFAIVVAEKYYEAEIIKAMEVDRTDTSTDLELTNRKIRKEVADALKYACKISSAKLLTEHHEKLQTEFDATYQGIYTNISKSTIGVNLNMTGITASAFVGGKCVNILNGPVDEIGFNTEITFENIGNEFTRFSIKDFLMVPVGYKFDVNWPTQQKRYPVENLLASVFGKLKKTAEFKLNSTAQICVIAVPKQFMEVQRNIIYTAAKMSGFDKVKIVNESCAAAISFTMEPNSPTPDELVVVIFQEDGWENCCYQRKGGQLVCKSASGHKYNGSKNKVDKKFGNSYNRIIEEAKGKANFGNALTLIVDTTLLITRSFIETYSYLPFKIRETNVVTRGSAIYAGLIGENIKLKENWARATNSEFPGWENVLNFES